MLTLQSCFDGCTSSYEWVRFSRSATHTTAPPFYMPTMPVHVLLSDEFTKTQEDLWTYSDNGYVEDDQLQLIGSGKHAYIPALEWTWEAGVGAARTWRNLAGRNMTQA